MEVMRFVRLRQQLSMVQCGVPNPQSPPRGPTWTRTTYILDFRNIMQIDSAHFTPWTSLAGGILIGAAAGALILVNGRIAGISGILGGLIEGVENDLDWRVAFLLGLVAAPLVWGLVAHLPEAKIDASFAVVALAGAFVGVGTRLGSGCTSGHGVCGLSRLSVRSLAATITFMAIGMGTVYVLRRLFVFQG